MSGSQDPTPGQEQRASTGGGAEETRGVSGGLVVVAAGQTDIGCQRQVNQDALGNLAHNYAAQAADLGLLYVVADGMGGHARGEVASAMAVENMFERYYAADPRADPEDVLVGVLLETNTAIHDAGLATDGNHMGTTVTAVLLRDDKLYVGNIGDSRTYRLRDGQIQQLSRDHSLIGEQVRSGLITTEQARQSNIRNVITRALGYRPVVEPDTFAFSVKQGDILLLCSDGLHGLVEDAELAQVLLAEPLGVAVSHLIELARERGGHDNITALALRVDSVVAATKPPETTQPRGAAAASLSEAETQPISTIGATAEDVTITDADAGPAAGQAAIHDAPVPADDQPTAPLVVPPPPAPAPVPPVHPAPAAAPAKPRRRSWFWLFALVPFIILGLVVVAFLMLPQFRGRATAVATAQPTAQAVAQPTPQPTAKPRATPTPAPRPGVSGGLVPPLLIPTPIPPATVAPGGGRSAEGGDIVIEGTIEASRAGLDLARDWYVALLVFDDAAPRNPLTGEALVVAPIQVQPDGTTSYKLTAPSPGSYQIVIQKKEGNSAIGPPTRLLCEPDRITVQQSETLNQDLSVR